MPRGIHSRRKYGYWTPFKDAVAAMQPNDLLIWEMPQDDADTAQSRASDLCNDECKLSAHWCDGKLFVVRMR